MCYRLEYGLRPTVIALAVLICCFATPAELLAHPSVKARLESLNTQLKTSPANASLYVKRAGVYTDHKDWELALADLQRARELNPADSSIDYQLALLWLAAKDAEKSLLAINRYLQLEPNNINGLVARAKAKEQLDTPAEGAADLSQAISLSKTASPDLYFERARLLWLAGPAHWASSVSGLQEGVAKLGPLVTLITPLVDAEAALGRYDDALTHFDLLPAKLRQQAKWLTKRGHILNSAGRIDEAATHYSAAAAAIDKLPERRRQTEAMQQLQREISNATAH